ncbi:fam-l protein [Plasmodium malariae]|uniref:Fam-l protein n=1 Tax=Plasmodium malariae TaxID=5858 RepID=A0A1D3TDQ1_PLAMA|nr:fam-l protein [Plasmodium malariae]SCP03056.1 fam-l protein [Plasmodium malariae]
MEQEIKLPIFIKVSIFIFFSAICHFFSYMSLFDKFLYKKKITRCKLHIKTYRLLAKCKQDKYSNILHLKKEIHNKIMNKEKDIYINEERNRRKMKQQDVRSLNNTGDHKLCKKNKSNIFETIKLSHMEKNIFKELDFEDFLKNNRTISYKTYKKIIRKKLALRFSVPLLLLLLLSLSMIINISCFRFIIKGLFDTLRLYLGGSWYGSLNSLLKNSTLGFLFKSEKTIKLKKWIKESRTLDFINDYDYVYGFFRYLLCLIYLIAFLILGVTLILGIVYYHKKVKKYQKIKFIKK